MPSWADGAVSFLQESGDMIHKQYEDSSEEDKKVLQKGLASFLDMDVDDLSAEDEEEEGEEEEEE